MPNDLHHTLDDDAVRAYAATLGDDPLVALIEAELAGQTSELEALRKSCAPQPKVGQRWDRGLITAARILSDGRKKQGAQWLDQLYDAPAGRFVRELWFGHSRPKNTYKHALLQLVARTNPALRTVFVGGDRTDGKGFEGLKGLHEAAPGLTSLSLTGTFSAGAIKALVGTWPALERLQLDFAGNEPWKKPPSWKPWKKLLTPAQLPALQHLRIERSGMDDGLLDHLVGSGLLPQLERLQIGGFFSEEALQRLLDAVPASCILTATACAPHDDHQRIVAFHHREPAAQSADYERLWTTTWAEGGFEGTTAHEETHFDATTRWFALPDGTLHGPRIRKDRNNIQQEWFWYGVLHGVARRDLLKNPAVWTLNYRNGALDGEHRTERDGRGRISDYAQGVQVTYQDFGVDPAVLAARAAHQKAQERLGTVFSLNGTDRFSLGPATHHTTADALPTPIATAFSRRLNGPVEDVFARTDDGVRVQDLTLTKSGDVLQAVTWFMGDTLVGLVLEGGKRVARIEDGEIRLG